MHISFVLVNTAVPQNIGAAARAMNTMGFIDLRLVTPRCNHCDENAWWMAHGSTAILKNARIYPSLQSALVDCDFCIGTSARKRSAIAEYIPAASLTGILNNKKSMVHRAAIIFGSEEHGLTNNDLELCHCVSTIPIFKKYPSLNLSQAIMVFAYELSSLSNSQSGEPSDPCQYSALAHKIQALFTLIKLPSSSGVRRRITQKMALLGSKDLHCIHSICSKVLNELSSK